MLSAPVLRLRCNPRTEPPSYSRRDVSLNRETDQGIVFVKGEGALLWDADGNRYIDYHAAFAPYLLGHNDPSVNDAVERVLRDGSSLFGVNTTTLEGRLAELICECVPFADSVQVVNTGSEATYQAMRAARAFTSRDHVIVMQGSYNGRQTTWRAM